MPQVDGMGLAVPYAIYGLGLALALAAGLPIVNPVSALWEALPWDPRPS